jgi:uncharacterized membrane protein YhiD involved in acid resistance
MLDLLNLQNNAEDPTLVMIIFTVLSAFLLSTLIVFTYDKTSRDVLRPVNYMQALVLISMVASIVMQAIGDSLARGLGMLGALAIIRFRTTLRNPRNMVFMFASIAVGIACGVNGYMIAFVGAVFFCLVAFALRFSSFSRNTNLLGQLRFLLPRDRPERSDVENILRKHSPHLKLVRYRLSNAPEKGDYLEFEYQVRLPREDRGFALLDDLHTLEGIRDVRLNFRDTPESL